MDLEELRAALRLLVRDAIRDDRYTADGEHLILPIDSLIELGCMDEFDKIDVRVEINKFNERNPDPQET